jgi:two-component system, OmpR family, response regulator VanR
MNKGLMNLKNKTLLYVEDDEKVRNDTLGILQVMFHRVTTASDGIEALEKYHFQRPDMIFTDIKMPHMDGLEFIQEVRQHDRRTPVLFCSAHSEQKLLLKAANLKIDGYILKPITLEALFEAFGKCAENFSSGDSLIIEFVNGTRYNTSINELQNGTKTVSLSPKEYQLMNALLKKHPNILTKEELSYGVWPNDSVTNGAIKITIARLRAKIGNESIVAVNGIGWRLEL